PYRCTRASRGLGIVRQPKWKQHVGQNIGDARIADEGHFLRRCTSCERVMKIPKRMLQRLKEIMCDRRAVLAGGALKTGPIARQDCQRGQPALRMIYRTRTAQPPCVGW